MTTNKTTNPVSKSSITTKPKNSTPATNTPFVSPVQPAPAPTESPNWKRAFWGLMAVVLLTFWTVGYEQGFHSDEIDMNQYGKAVVAYYQSGGKDSTYLQPKLEDGTKTYTTISAYGPLFEYISLGINQLIGNKDGYEYNVSHALTQFLAFLTVLCTALLVQTLGGGYLGAFITALLLFISPHFFGHALTNNKDIPFALGYVGSLYFLARLLNELPHFKTGSLVGTFFSLWVVMAIRPAGLIVVAYMGLFLVAYLLLKPKSRSDWRAVGFSIGKLVAVGIAAYAVTVAIWPRLHAHPLTAYLDLFSFVKKFPQKINFVFGGQEINSLTTPKNYLYRIMGITIPAAVILGGFASIGMFVVRLFQRRFYAEGFLLFVTTFPLIYAVGSKVNLYNHWRHFLFIYPLLIAFIGFTFTRIIQHKSVKRQLIGIAAMLLVMAHPIYSIAKAPSYAYMYYNEWSGGHKKVFARYESDYRQMSVKPAIEWLMENEPAILKAKDSVVVATNVLSASYIMFKKKYPKAKVKLIFSGYKSRNGTAWDYGVFNYFLLTPEILLNDWPAYQTIHSEEVDGKPVTIVIKRTNRDDLLARDAMVAQNWKKADSLYSAYLAKDPLNYELCPNAVLAKNNANKPDEGLALAKNAMVYLPNNALLRYYTALCWLQKGNRKAAIAEMNNAIQLKCTDLSVYQNLANAYQQEGNTAMAQKILSQMPK
jgi:MFS family permease